MQPILNVHTSPQTAECSLSFWLSPWGKSTHTIWWAEDRCWADNLTKEEFPHLKHHLALPVEQGSIRERDRCYTISNSIGGCTEGLLPEADSKRYLLLFGHHRKPTFKQKNQPTDYQFNIQIKLAIILNSLLCLKLILSWEIIIINIITPGTGFNTQNILY